MPLTGHLNFDGVHRCNPYKWRLLDCLGRSKSPRSSALHPMDEIAAMEFLLDKMKNTKSNDEFFGSMRK